MSIDILMAYFENHSPLSEAEKEAIHQYFTLKNIKKREYLLQENEICRYFYFVAEGCLKMYKINEQGSENITEFAIENQWITDFESFQYQKKSSIFIEALENATIFQISKENWEKLCCDFPKIERMFFNIYCQKLADYQVYIRRILGSPSAERYLFFEKIYPHLVGRISQVQIASFLGITPECVSRLKNHFLVGSTDKQ